MTCDISCSTCCVTSQTSLDLEPPSSLVIMHFLMLSSSQFLQFFLLWSLWLLGLLLESSLSHTCLSIASLALIPGCLGEFIILLFYYVIII